MSRSDQDLERIRELEARGASFSRNRDFAFYSQPPNMRARNLRRFLRAIAAEIEQGAGRFEVSVSVDAGDVWHLRIQDPIMGTCRRVRLSRAEAHYVAEVLGRRLDEFMSSPTP